MQIKMGYLLIFSYVTLAVFTPSVGDSFGGLYPRESVSREVRNLDGIWDFRLAPLHDPDLGFREKWYEQPLKLTGDTIRMPVPSSYNDITQSKELRDHIGWAWYDRQFYVPRRWIEDNQRIVLRFGSAHYNSILYVNGNEVLTHEFGHLPFMAEITDLVDPKKANLVTICINNTLTPLTIPQGEIIYETDLQMYPKGYFTQNYDFDFFNYAGIHRPVFLYTTPKTYIEDISVRTQISEGSGMIVYNVSVNSPSLTIHPTCVIDVYDEESILVETTSACSGVIVISDAKLWWPYLMSDDPGYMYTLMVKVSDSEGRVDVYPQKIGIRSITWNTTTILLNSVPMYLRGCGKHEDHNIIGRGMEYANIAKDFNLLKWLGANSFRTSHYPYAEEIMDMADEEGIMVIDESPAVNLKGFGDELLSKHKTVMEAMFRRDKNKPSVIMWSTANEPNSNQEAAANYFRQVSLLMWSIDPTRPVTAALSQSLSSDLAAPSLDVILLNKYYSWYHDTGHLELIQRQTLDLFSKWHHRYNKPVMMSEYGAGTIAGLHMGPAFVWSEEYQVQLMIENFKAFDKLRTAGFFFGEMIWNFADFATAQESTRVGGNKKGIFTRDRQPKMSAHILRQRYHELANKTTSPQFKLEGMCTF